MKKIQKIALGGGAYSKLTQPSRPIKIFFNPLVATSLALALGVNVANATISITGEGNPNITLTMALELRHQVIMIFSQTMVMQSII